MFYRLAKKLKRTSVGVADRALPLERQRVVTDAFLNSSEWLLEQA